jgi:hypothetical protein
VAADGAGATERRCAAGALSLPQLFYPIWVKAERSVAIAMIVNSGLAQTSLLAPCPGHCYQRLVNSSNRDVIKLPHLHAGEQR